MSIIGKKNLQGGPDWRAVLWKTDYCVCDHHCSFVVVVLGIKKVFVVLPFKLS